MLVALGAGIALGRPAAAQSEPADWEVQTTRGIVTRASTCSVQRGMLQILSGRFASGARWGSVTVITRDPLYLGSRVTLELDGESFVSNGRFELTPRLLAALRSSRRAQIVWSLPGGGRREATIALSDFSEAFEQCVAFLER